MDSDAPRNMSSLLVEYRLTELEKEIASVRVDVEKGMAETKADIRDLGLRMDRRDGQSVATMVGALVAAGGVIVTMLVELTKVAAHP